MPLGQGNNSWLFLSKEPLHIPVVDYLWALSGQSELLSFGEKKKKKRESFQYVMFVC